MKNRTIYLTIIEDKDNFGIDANIQAYTLQDKAIACINSHYNQFIAENTVDGYLKMPHNKIKPDETFSCYARQDSQNNQYTGQILALEIADTPKFISNEYKEIAKSLTEIINTQNNQFKILHEVFENEINFDLDKEIISLNKYKKIISSLTTEIDNTIKLLKKRQNQLWLSVDEGQGEMDYALFYNKNVAKEYLFCRFMQAINFLQYNKEKSCDEQNKFLANEKSSYNLIGDNVNCYGKIIQINVK